MNRFRIDVSRRDGRWYATVWDLGDHGLKLKYAEISSDDLGFVLGEASHYALVAAS